MAMRRRPMRLPIRRSLVCAFVVAAGVPLAALPGAAGVVTDDTPPVVTYTVNGIAGTNGWYRGSTHGNFVIVNWSVSDPESPITATSGCEPAVNVPGPDKGTTRTCSATSDGGTATVTTKVLKIDADPPSGVSASFARGADFNGWFNHAVAVTWQGADATSGIASCSAVTYGGPDQAGASVGGGCTDNAGNVASTPVSLNYDATAPVLTKPTVQSRNGSDLVQWKSSSPVDTAVVQRWQRGAKDQPVVFRGSGAGFTDKKVEAGLEYMYAVQTFDQAGNASKRLLVAGLAKVVTLRKLPYVPRVSDKPILRWAAVRGASYYNVQLYRGSKRVFAAWPVTNQLGLPAGWRWNGHRFRLGPGRYRWYVWAGFGPRSFARYRTVGTAQFVVPR
jgi:hypothetical protein